MTTIEQKGKGFDSWARLTTFGNKKKGESKSFAKMISQMFGGDVKERGNKKVCEIIPPGYVLCDSVVV